MTTWTSGMMPQGVVYSTSTGDDRVWVSKNGVTVGWYRGDEFTAIVTDDEAGRMLREALKRKPPKPAKD